MLGRQYVFLCVFSVLIGKLGQAEEDIPVIFGDVPVGGDCRVGTDCKDYPQKTECNTQFGQCTCKSGFTEIPPPPQGVITCGEIRTSIGQSCEHNNQCVFSQLLQCLEDPQNPGAKVCRCETGAVNQPGQNLCFPVMQLIGDSCTVNVQCSTTIGPYSMCNNQKCACMSNAMGTVDNTRCVPYINQIGGECIYPEQCIRGEPGQFSDCMPHYENPDKYICNCTDVAINEPGFHKCHEKREFVGDSCMVHAQCRVNLGSLAICDGRKTCQCEPSKGVPNEDGNLCLPIVNEIGQPCEIADQCAAGTPGDWSDCVFSATANEKVCECTEFAVHIPGEHECLLKAEYIQDDCRHDLQCTANLGDSSYCDSVMDVCQCHADAVEQSDQKMCLPIRHMLGEECKEESQCTQGIPGRFSECNDDNVCACKSNAAHEPGHHECFPIVTHVGDDCNFNSQCQKNLGMLSVCVAHKTCQCLETYAVARTDGTYCLPIRNELGDDCEQDSQCQHGVPGSNSVCSPTKEGETETCNCMDGSVHSTGEHKCYEASQHVGDLCVINEQCLYNLGTMSICINGVCECDTENGLADPDNSSCIAIIDQIGSECQHDSQCRAGAPGSLSVCEGTCQCLAQAVKDPNSNKCYEKATALEDGFRCQINIQCSFNLGDDAGCNEEGYCKCMNNSVPNMENGPPNTKCITGGLHIRDECTDMAQCPGIPGVSSLCSIRGICGCLSEYTASSDLSDCLRIRNELGQPCVENHQCQEGVPGNHSICVQKINPVGKVCECDQDSVTETNKHVCYKKAIYVGDTCVKNEQCLANLVFSHCLQGVCKCFQNSTASSSNTECVQQAGLDQDCIDPNQCSHIVHSVCNMTLNKCECNIGYVPNPLYTNKCMKVAELIGDSCQEHPRQCDSLPTSKCHPDDLSCSCEDDTEVVSASRKECLPALDELQLLCDETPQCKVVDSICDSTNTSGNPHCICIPETFIEYNITTCLKVKRFIGEDCEDNIQCQVGLNSSVQCLQDRCKCPPGQEFYQDDCYVPKHLRSPCDNEEECKLISELLTCKSPNNTCECVKDAIEITGSCWAKKLIGDDCKTDAECRATIKGHVDCSKTTGVCECTDGTKPDWVGIECSNSSNNNPTSILIFITLLFVYLYKYL